MRKLTIVFALLVIVIPLFFYLLFLNTPLHVMY